MRIAVATKTLARVGGVEAYVERWLGIMAASFEPGAEYHERAVELGLRKRPGKATLDDYLGHLSARLAPYGIRLPSW